MTDHKLEQGLCLRETLSYFRRALSLIVLFAGIATAVSAQNVDFSFSSFPVDGGARNTAGIRLLWPGPFSSVVSGALEETALASELDGFPESLLYTEQRTMDLNVQLLAYSRSFSLFSVMVGAGGSLNRQEVLERGNFVLDVPQVFRNQYTATRFGPLAAARLRAFFFPVSVTYTTEVVPFYVFTLDQDIEILPLVAERASWASEATGGFAWDQNMRVGLWSHLEMELSYGLDRLQLDVLGLGSDSSGFVFEPDELDVLFETIRLFGNIVIPMSNGTRISVGGGYEWKTTDFRSSQDSEPTQIERWLWKVELGW